MKLNYRKQNVLILGGSSELGMALAQKLINIGLFPILSYRNGSKREFILDSLKDKTELFETVQIDFLRKVNPININVDYVVDLIQSEFEEFILMGNNERIGNLFQEVAHKTLFLKNLAKTMLKQKFGRMVFISSAAVNRMGKGQGFYVAAKEAQESLYRCLGLELGSKGISTVSLRLGHIEVGRGRNFIVKHRKSLLSHNPLKRFLRIEEVVETILFFLSDSSLSFNSTEITMDSGFSALKL